MKTNQDGGGDSPDDAAKQLKNLGSPKKGAAKYDRVVLGGNTNDKSKTKPGEKDYAKQPKGADKKYKGGPKYMDEGAEKKYKGGAKLSPKQEKMDKNKNGKIDGQDFKMMGANRMGYTQTPGAARKKMGDVVQGIMRNGPADMTGKKHSHTQEELDANRGKILNDTQPPIAGRDKALKKFGVDGAKFGYDSASYNLKNSLTDLTKNQRGLDSIKMTEKPNDMFFRDKGKLKVQK